MTSNFSSVSLFLSLGEGDKDFIYFAVDCLVRLVVITIMSVRGEGQEIEREREKGKVRCCAGAIAAVKVDCISARGIYVPLGIPRTRTYSSRASSSKAASAWELQIEVLAQVALEVSPPLSLSLPPSVMRDESRCKFKWESRR